jgi:hypothetical protein
MIFFDFFFTLLQIVIYFSINNYSQKMSTKHIISTINVILALLVTFSTQLNYNQSDTYQDLNEWSLETNLLEFNDDSNEQLLAFSKF